MDKQLKKLYRLPEAQALERESAKADRHRQKLLHRYSRLSAIIYSPHPWNILAPIRSYRLAILVYRLERNRLKHRHRAVKTMLQSRQAIIYDLLRAHKHTSLSDVYKLFGLKPPAF